MIRVITSMLLLVTAVLLTACAGGPQAAEHSDGAPINSPTVTLVVHGMSCPLCANNVDEQLLDVPGVRAVNVDMGAGHVKVSLDPGANVSRADLSAAIERSGFTLADVVVP